jgi:hypothetical protein
MVHKYNECITCRCTQKSGEVWIKNKKHPKVILCPSCAKKVNGCPDDWETIKDTAGVLKEEEVDLFNSIAQRLKDEYGDTGYSKLITEYGVFIFTPKK